MRKKAEDYVFTGFGFPVVLRGASMKEFRGEQLPDINFNELQAAVLDAMVFKPARLTGSELKFIRVAFDLTQGEFGELIDVTHARVSQWEKLGHQPASMGLTSELAIRLKIARGSKHPKSKEFVEIYDQLVELQKLLAAGPPKGTKAAKAGEKRFIARWPRGGSGGAPEQVSYAA